jgi:hypothetical protein
MAGRINPYNPFGNPHGKVNPNELPQQLGARIKGAGNVPQGGYGFQPIQTLSENIAPAMPQWSAKNRVFMETSPSSGSMVGVMAPMRAGRKFNAMDTKHYIMQGSMDHLASSGNSLLNAPSQLAPYQRNANNWKGDELTGLVDWDFLTGQPTYNANRGVRYQGINPIGGAAGVEPIPTDAAPGKVVYMVTGQVPTQSNYGPRHDG